MTEALNGHQPTDDFTPLPTGHNGIDHAREPHVGEISNALEKRQRHANQDHLDALIHAGVITHLIRVDEVPDRLYALSQMKEMPEVRFAAVFDDGLIALGCPDGLPQALASLATPATASMPVPGTSEATLTQIEGVTDRLAALVDMMEPEEVVLNEEVGRSILDRLDAMEAKVIQTPAQPDIALQNIEQQLSALHVQVSAMPDPVETLARIDAKLADFATLVPGGTTTAQSNDQFEQIGSLLSMVMQRIETATADLTQQSNKTMAALADNTKDLEVRVLERLTQERAQIEEKINMISPATADQMAAFEDTLNTLSQSQKSLIGSQAGSDLVADKLEQLAAAQRTALGRIEAAMGKAVSGLEPALDHLNARAAETENMLSDWHKDLKSLSKRTGNIADHTGEIQPLLTALQTEMTTLAHKPVPQLDLTAQQESLSAFGASLNGTLTEIKTLARKSDEKTAQTALQSDETIATLQSLPNLIGATLRRDADLKPLEQSLCDLKDQLGSLPERLGTAEIAGNVSRLADQIGPLGTSQMSAFDDLKGKVTNVLTQIGTVQQGVVTLQAKEPDLNPLANLINNLHKQMNETTQDSDVQFDQMRETLSRLSQHLGLAQQSTHLVTASPLVPDSSLNTLRMEFADLITKRMKENGTPLPHQARQA